MMKDKCYRFEFWENGQSEYNFHFIAPNGDILAYSNQGYKNKSDMITAIQSIKGHADKAFIERIVKPIETGQGD